MATNILGLMDYMQKQGDAGRQQGQQQSFNRLAGQAYTAPAAQQGALVGQMVGIDPQAGMAMGGALAGRNQAADVDHMKKLGGAARYMASALQSNNPAQVEGAWQAVRPYLVELTGKQPPMQWDPAMEPALYQAIAKTGGMPDEKGVVLSAGGQLRNPTTGALLANNPQSLQYHDVPMGAGTAAGVFNPADGTVRPAVGGATQPGPQGAPQGDPMQPFIEQANAAIKMGAPEDQVRAWLQQQSAAMGGQPVVPSDQSLQGQAQALQAPAAIPQGQPSAQFGVGTAKQGQQVRTLSDAELKQYNLPTGTVAQMDGNGKISVVNKPGQDSSTVTPPGDPTQTGEAYLQSLPANMRSVVKAIAHGDQAPPSASSRSPAAQALLQAVYTYDPTASASNLPTRTATRKSFTSGKDAQNMTALSQLALHLDHLDGQIGTIAGHAAPNFVNGAVNAVEDKFNGKTTAFESSANAVAHELRAVFANANGGTQAELEENLKQLNSSNSEAQKKAAVKNIAQLVHGRFAILQDKYAQGMGKTEDPFQTSYPGAESTILRLSGATPEGQQAPAAGGVDHLLSKYGVH